MYFFQMKGNISWTWTVGKLCVNHCIHFVFELCKSMNIRSIEMLLIDNGKSSQEPHNGDVEN